MKEITICFYVLLIYGGLNVLRVKLQLHYTRKIACFKLFHLKKCSLNCLSGMCEVEVERVNFFFKYLDLYV